MRDRVIRPKIIILIEEPRERKKIEYARLAKRGSRDDLEFTPPQISYLLFNNVSSGYTMCARWRAIFDFIITSTCVNNGLKLTEYINLFRVRRSLITFKRFPPFYVSMFRSFDVEYLSSSARNETSVKVKSVWD